jgi:RHS repeat-associated protein
VAREAFNGEGIQWQQTYVYDRYGNRTIDTNANATFGGVNNLGFELDTARNRLYAPGDLAIPEAERLMQYDDAGNLKQDTYTGGGEREYDAENRMVAATNNDAGASTYTYDGDGRRVRRTIDGGVTWQVYGLGGELLAEYDHHCTHLRFVTCQTKLLNEYGYRNGQFLITTIGTSDTLWLVTDQLGTPRMIFDKTGTLAGVRRHDYLPFGEDLFRGIGGRSDEMGYGPADGVRQKFTSKERDTETGLDYFLARYHSSTQGRFTSPDPLLSSGRPAVPDSWNRYTYVLNNPLALVDPDGLDWGVATWQEGDQTITEYRWFNGKIGKHGATYDGHTYSAVKFDHNGRGSLDVVDNEGNIIKISNYGHVYQVIYTGPGGEGRDTGQGSPLNASAGMVDGAIPFGKEIREGVFGKMGVDTSAPEYQNAATISGGMVIGVSLLDGVGEVKIAGCLVETTTPTRIYSASTLLRMEEESGPMHNFPESFNAEIFQGSRTVTRDFFNVDKQGLSNDSIMYRTPGSVNGKGGTFEIGVRPSLSGKTEVITHRFFRPGP